MTEAEIFVKDPFVKKEYLRQAILLLRPKLHCKTDEGVSVRGVFPVHTDDCALLFGPQLAVTCLTRSFRDDRALDPALGFFEGEWFHAMLQPSWDCCLITCGTTDHALGVQRSMRWCSEYSICSSSA